VAYKGGIQKSFLTHSQHVLTIVVWHQWFMLI